MCWSVKEQFDPFLLAVMNYAVAKKKNLIELFLNFVRILGFLRDSNTAQWWLLWVKCLIKGARERVNIYHDSTMARAVMQFNDTIALYPVPFRIIEATGRCFAFVFVWIP